MLNTDDIVFISNEFYNEQYSKIARILNAHEIKTTTDINSATIVVKPVKKPLSQKQDNNLIVALIKKIDETKEEIIKLYDQVFLPRPHFEIPTVEIVYSKPKERNKNKFIQNQKLAKFNKIKYKHKQILFNRTRHK